MPEIEGVKPFTPTRTAVVIKLARHVTDTVASPSLGNLSRGIVLKGWFSSGSESESVFKPHGNKMCSKK